MLAWAAEDTKYFLPRMNHGNFCNIKFMCKFLLQITNNHFEENASFIHCLLANLQFQLHNISS